jgi:hypothetical protein
MGAALGPSTLDVCLHRVQATGKIKEETGERHYTLQVYHADEKKTYVNHQLLRERIIDVLAHFRGYVHTPNLVSYNVGVCREQSLKKSVHDARKGKPS